MTGGGLARREPVALGRAEADWGFPRSRSDGPQSPPRLLSSPRALANLSADLPFDAGAILRLRSLAPLAAVARDPVRRIGYTSFRGYYRSLRMGVRFPYESLLERDALIAHDFLPFVRRFSAQPVTIHYRRLGRKRRYTPDMLVQVGGQTPFLLEVRPADRVNGRLAALMPWLSEACAEFGCVLHPIDETSIRAEPFHGNCLRARSAVRFLTDDNLPSLGEALARREPPVELGDLCAAMGRPDDALELILGLIAVDILAAPLGEELRSSTPLTKGRFW